MSFDFMNRAGLPTPNFYGQQSVNPYQQQQVAIQPQQQINPAMFETPNIVSSGKPFFSVIREGSENKALVPIDNSSDAEVEAKKRGPGRPRKEESGSTAAIVRPEQQIIEDMPTGYTYMETTAMLRETLGQIDSLNAELMQEFSNIKLSRTLKNKHQVMIGLSENVGALLSNKISAIREINSSISKANDMDYKKEKDRKAASANIDDDKYIADLYKSFMQNPANTMNMTPQMPQIDPSIFGSGIVRADLGPNNSFADASYLNYMSNLSPEQNLMRYEGNGNVKQVVVYDAATGNKFFQMMDISTNQVIPNVPTYDQMFMEDTTIDLANKIAKNINLNETFPVIVINEGVTSQY